MPFDGWMDGWGEMAANARQPPPLFFHLFKWLLDGMAATCHLPPSLAAVPAPSSEA